ncbi:hypothetical protein Adt_39543 [Abeliophyllum distichum]|uniref:Uncharacterized protein n=1 Tax=Abeliophyllum distichum TaxID=126358 RepID=A0ABD1Q5D8_9LAMI
MLGSYSASAIKYQNTKKNLLKVCPSFRPINTYIIQVLISPSAKCLRVYSKANGCDIELQPPLQHDDSEHREDIHLLKFCFKFRFSNYTSYGEAIYLQKIHSGFTSEIMPRKMEKLYTCQKSAQDSASAYEASEYIRAKHLHLSSFSLRST